MAGCQADAINNGDSKDEASDVSDALSQLPDATVQLYAANGLPQSISGDLGRVDVSRAGLVASDDGLRAAMTTLLKAFRLENKDLVLRKVNTDEFGSKHYRYEQKLNGLDVVGASLVVHLDSKGVIFGANGTARGELANTLGAASISDGAATLAIAADARWAGITGRTVTGSRAVYI
jgi:hypothetical protein